MYRCSILMTNKKLLALVHHLLTEILTACCGFSEECSVLSRSSMILTAPRVKLWKICGVLCALEKVEIWDIDRWGPLFVTLLPTDQSPGWLQQRGGEQDERKAEQVEQENKWNKRTSGNNRAEA